MSLVKELTTKKLITPPVFLPDNVVYETRMGSVAYGCSEDASDVDVYAFAIPTLENTFSHLRGEFPGFGKNEAPFEVYQKHHIKDADKEYDINVYSIIKYFHLCADANPNMLDSMFTRDEDVITNTTISKLVRNNRKLFLSKQVYARFLGYAKSESIKMRVSVPNHTNERRAGDVAKYGYSLKNGYHLVRLAEEAYQMLTTGDMDLKASADILRHVRAGRMTLTELEKHISDTEERLKAAYNKTDLPDRPDFDALRELLLNCFEEFYGTLDFFVKLGVR